MPVKRECQYAECPVEAALDLIGGKWKTMIVALLLTRAWRFNELQRRLKGVTHRVLSAQLRDLEACGLVERTVFAETPPRVEYALTEVGRSLNPVIEELTRWGATFAQSRRAAATEPSGNNTSANSPTPPT